MSKLSASRPGIAVRLIIYRFGYWKKRTTIKILRWSISVLDAVKERLALRLLRLEPPEPPRAVTRQPMYRERRPVFRYPRRIEWFPEPDEDDPENT
jgi:hypothetical protein